MTNKGQEFLDAMNKAGGAATGGIVAQVKVQFGFHRYVSGQDFWAGFFPYHSPDKADEAKEACQEWINKHGGEGWPTKGIGLTIYKDDVPSSVSGKHKADMHEFTGQFQTDAYQIVLDALASANAPISEKFWARIKAKYDPFAKAKGEAGKSIKHLDANGNPDWPRVRYVAEVFANRKEAVAGLGSTAQEPVKTDDGSLSKLARDNGYTYEFLNGVFKPQLRQQIEEKQKKDKLNFKDAVDKVAGDNSLEIADLELIGVGIP